MVKKKTDSLTDIKIRYQTMIEDLRADGMNVYLKLVKYQKRYGYQKDWIYARLKVIKPHLDVWEAFEVYWRRDPGWGYRQWVCLTAIRNEWIATGVWLVTEVSD